MAFLSVPVTVRAPATSANLGPGFDALGLALTVYDDIRARVTEEPGVRVAVAGEGAGELPTDERHLVVRAMEAAFKELGHPLPGLELDCRNGIPQARGLGSSSAAIVGGILVARGLVAGGAAAFDDAAVLRLAAQLEGHPDNVAPCLLGGFTVAWTDASGARAVRLEVSTAIRPFAFVPDERGLTEEARAALPAAVPHGDASFNAARAALLVHALVDAPEHLLAATEDRLHQPYRAAGMACTAALVRRLRDEGIAAVVSGAGPTVLALATGDWTPPAVEGWRVWPLNIDSSGAYVAEGGS